MTRAISNLQELHESVQNMYSTPRVSHRRPHSRPRRGAAIIEMVVAVSLVSMFAFGMVEFGYYFYVSVMLESSAREGVRAGIPSAATNTDVTIAAENALSTCKWPTGDYTVTITDLSNNPIDVSTAAAGTQIRVSVTATWGTIAVGFRPLAMIGANKQIVGVCVMRKEG